MKVVIFGVGKIFNEYVKKIDFRNVVAIIDNCRDVQYRKIYGHSVIAPDRIGEFDYDYVVDRCRDTCPLHLLYNGRHMELQPADGGAA